MPAFCAKEARAETHQLIQLIHGMYRVQPFCKSASMQANTVTSCKNLLIQWCSNLSREAEHSTVAKPIAKKAAVRGICGVWAVVRMGGAQLQSAQGLQVFKINSKIYNWLTSPVL